MKCRDKIFLSKPCILSQIFYLSKRDEYSVLEFEVPISGAYFVKIGNYKAKKVVVIK